MNYTAAEMMTVAAARALANDDICFVGIGLPSAACNLARLTHAPGITLIYESGTIRTRPAVLPLSIGDGELCETALDHRLGAGDVPLLAAGRTHHGRIPERRASGSLRQSEQHRHRRLSAGPRCGCRAAAAPRKSPTVLRRDLHRHAPSTRELRRRARFRHFAGPRPQRHGTRRSPE